MQMQSQWTAFRDHANLVLSLCLCLGHQKVTDLGPKTTTHIQLKCNEFYNICMTFRVFYSHIYGSSYMSIVLC